MVMCMIWIFKLIVPTFFSPNSKEAHNVAQVISKTVKKMIYKIKRGKTNFVI